MHVVCCMLHDACCMSRVACCLLHLAGCMMSVAGCMMSVACCMLHVACCSGRKPSAPQANCNRCTPSSTKRLPSKESQPRVGRRTAAVNRGSRGSELYCKRMHLLTAFMQVAAVHVSHQRAHVGTRRSQCTAAQRLAPGGTVSTCARRYCECVRGRLPLVAQTDYGVV